ncbi:hypothetical protein C8A01DRAFT_51494 [Parachaetomium inaequale]|uniref:Rhodopsin domain-containing protein n=1 Tax=Parachaetomium inaequale TaxID=2588326 RepID=A0AAN6P630_9PEZI|nr:hypothetical protein C8A01DRAFT_51494 [Parachaetomium inaequale]
MASTDTISFLSSTRANVGIWVLISTSAVFLLLRLWLRHRSAKLWWDDMLLSVSWVLMLVAGALISRIITVGVETDNDKRVFFRFQNASVILTTLATNWAKIAFAITLIRIARHKAQLCFLWFIIVTANLILIPGAVSSLVPACSDPRAKFRPVDTMCLELSVIQYLGGATMAYGGVIDILLALLPMFIVRNLKLETKEKIGLTVAMGLGALTGATTVLRTFLQLVQGDYNYDFMVYVSIFSFLEPSVTIVAQAIPIFRVLVVRAAKNGSLRLLARTAATSVAERRPASIPGYSPSKPAPYS